MSLYDGLDVDISGDGKKGSENSSASVHIKFLQSQLLLKKAAVEQSKVKLLKPSSVTKNSAIRPATVVGANAESAAKDLQPSESFIKIENEYDPLYPNDYEKVKAIHAAEAAALAASIKANPFQSTFSNTIGVRSQLIAPEYDPDSESEDAQGFRENSEPSTSRRGAAFPPPSFLSSSTSSSLGSSSEGGGFAQKVMAKYGFKEGTGLGKDNQGIASALQVEKTGLRLGKIINEPPPSLQAPMFVGPSTLQTVTAPPPTKSIPTNLLKNQTKVLLLRNMVGPGEVDNDLEPEVKEECKKYGDVVSCVVFELPNRPDDEAVRIFVEFSKVEQAVKAAIDMSGRFFGGRCVKTGFYNYDHFKQFKLSD